MKYTIEISVNADSLHAAIQAASNALYDFESYGSISTVQSLDVQVTSSLRVKAHEETKKFATGGYTGVREVELSESDRKLIQDAATKGVALPKVAKLASGGYVYNPTRPGGFPGVPTA